MSSATPKALQGSSRHIALVCSDQGDFMSDRFTQREIEAFRQLLPKLQRLVELAPQLKELVDDAEHQRRQREEARLARKLRRERILFIGALLGILVTFRELVADSWASFWEHLRHGGR